MAERRMFAKTIVDSDAFLDMPLSAQALYFHLSMRADDDGFVNNPKKIQRMIGASDDDCKLLVMKRFILTFESGVIVIKHWRIHNYIQKDRYKETAYKEEKERLEIKENNAYTLKSEELPPMIEESAKTLRQKAYEESELPYSFDYKIRQAFVGKHCPICNCIMGYDNNLIQPTIQHNIPISKGGRHELGNISVICRSCNASVQDNETDELNANEVIEEWEKIGCTRLVHGMDTQVRLGKDSIEIEKDSVIDAPQKRFKPPTVEEVREYCKERQNNVDAERFVDYYTANDWKVGRNKMKDWKAAVRTWERNGFSNGNQKRGANGILLDDRETDELDGIL